MSESKKAQLIHFQPEVAELILKRMCRHLL